MVTQLLFINCDEVNRSGGSNFLLIARQISSLSIFRFFDYILLLWYHVVIKKFVIE